VAALYLVERIKNEVVSMAATHFQALAVGQARQRALRRLARNPPGLHKSLTVRTPPILLRLTPPAMALEPAFALLPSSHDAAARGLVSIRVAL
jgi:hypothetical protein